MNVLMTPVMITCYPTPVMIMVIICWLRYVSKRPKYCSLYSATNASYRACVYIVYSLCLRVFTSRSPQRAEYRALSKRFEKSLPSALRILLLNIIEYIYIYIYMWGTQQNYFLSAKICRHLAPPPRARFSRGMTSRSRAAATG